MRKDMLVYLSGPITPKHGRSVEENIATAMNVYWLLLKAGIPAIVPHATAIYPSAWSEVPYETWMDLDFRYIDVCTHVVLLPLWRESDGAKREAEYAAAQGKEVVHFETFMLHFCDGAGL